MSKHIVVGCFVLGKYLVFTRLYIHRGSYRSIVLGTREYVDRVYLLPIGKDRRKQSSHRFSAEHLTNYQGLAGSLNFLGHAILTQAAFAADHLQQSIGRFKVSHLMAAKQVLSELKPLSLTLTYKSVGFTETSCYSAFSDASQGLSWYGKTGYISGIFLPAEGANVIHALGWPSCNQKRLDFSSMGAEIIVAASSADLGSLMTQSISILNENQTNLPLVLTVDCRGLHLFIPNIQEDTDYRLRPTVARLKDSF